MLEIFHYKRLPLFSHYEHRDNSDNIIKRKGL